jgi:hypothetical protein
VGVAWWTRPDTHQAWEWKPADLYREIESWLPSMDVIVVEDFIISGQRAKEANVTIEMIGVLNYLTWKADIPLVRARPGAYKFADGPKLKRLGWYTKGSDHARSASGHLVKYLCESGLLDPARLLPCAEEGGDSC